MKALSTVVSPQPRRKSVPEDGSFRLQLRTLAGHRLAVGPFLTLTGARAFAHDLLSDAPDSLLGARIEFRNRGAWKPAGIWTGGAS